MTGSRMPPKFGARPPDPPKQTGYSSDDEWRHWTSHGAFRISRDYLLGMPCFVLWFRAEEIARYFSFMTAAGSIGEGEHDERLPVPGASLEVPDDPRFWNQLS